MHRFLFMLILASVEGWQVEWTAHPDNIAVVLVTTCYGKQPFFAYNHQDVNATQTQATFRRMDIPKGERCYVSAQLMRFSEEYPHGVVADATSTIQEE